MFDHIDKNAPMKFVKKKCARLNRRLCVVRSLREQECVNDFNIQDRNV